MDPTFPNYVCQLKRSLYGLKQAPRQWHKCLIDALLQFDFYASKADTSLYFVVHSNIQAFCLIYVDDILLMGSDSQFLVKVFHFLAIRFAIKDLGRPDYFLGIETLWCPNGLFLHQHLYVLNLHDKLQTNFYSNKQCYSTYSLKG